MVCNSFLLWKNMTQAEPFTDSSCFGYLTLRIIMMKKVPTNRQTMATGKTIR